ncbi:N-6 DNA methylase [Archaeoglobus sp.]
MLIRKEYESKQAEKHFKSKEKVLGQFWTPYPLAKFIVRFCLKFVDEKGLLLDPACGEGVFLKAGVEVGFREVVGIDVDSNILKHVPESLRNRIIIQNALEETGFEGKCDVVVGNPPFSSKFGKVTDRSILKRFELGRNRRSQSVEILFLEKFIELAKDGGVIGIILPFGVFANTQLSYVRKFIMEKLRVIAVISLPRNVFPKTTAKTCVLIGKKGKHEGKVLMAKIESLGELLNVEKLSKYVSIENDFLYPEYYIDRVLLRSQLKLGDVVSIRSGATEYGSKRFFVDSGIPFISAKVVTDLGLDFNRDRKFVKPNSIMDKKSAKVKAGDVLFVRVGVGCIGRTAVVLEGEEGIADDWLYILRVKDRRVSPFYVAFYLQTETIQREIRRLARGVGTVTIPQRLLSSIPFVFNKELNDLAENVYRKIVQFRKTGKVAEAKKIRKEFLERLERFIKSNILSG